MQTNQVKAGRRRRAEDQAAGVAARNTTSMAFALAAMAICTLFSTTTIGLGVEAFVPSVNVNRHRSIKTPTATNFKYNSQHSSTRIALNTNDADNTSTESVWSPGLRKIIAGVASLGAIETGYLTYAKLIIAPGQSTLFCGSSQAAVTSCDQVLNGPYSNIPFLDNVPLAALGFLAYSSVVALALAPLLSNNNNDDDTQNRILLTALTTAMGTFSIFLMTLLFGVLQASCPYCLFSAADSFMLANLSLIGGCLPEGTIASDGETRDTTGGKTVAVGFLGAFLGAVLVFGNGSIDAINNPPGVGGTSTLFATTLSNGNSKNQEMMLYAPPEITTDSSERALSVAKSLQQLDAKMYGAHWCSHCYDQKQTLGKQVFSKSGDKQPLVEYVECSKDGINSQSKVCKAKEIPGYPTWEIQGKQYPGEQSLDELEDLVKDIRSNKI